MSVFRYSKFKIIIDPKSKKTQGLSIGDIVRRQYVDNQSTIYSLMLVLETGVDVYIGANNNEEKSSYFIGALLNGDEPTNGQILDFVRVTNLFNINRSGALYLTASDNDSPYLDIVDGMATEKSLCFPSMSGGSPDLPDIKRYAVSGDGYVDTSYTASIDGASRVFRIVRNNIVNIANAKIGLKQTIGVKLKNPQRVVISYRIRSSKLMNGIPLSFGYTSGGTYDGQDSISSTLDWSYQANVITIDYPEQYSRSLFIDFTSFLTNTSDWVEVSDLNIVLLSDLDNFGLSTKARIGKISGIIDPVFGTIDGYGAYFQNLFASKNINIAGTLTAGDANGSSSSFYVGKIRKNNVINSLNPNFTTSNHAQILNNMSPVGVGGVYKLLSGVSEIHIQDKSWLDGKIGDKYCLSFWVKSEDRHAIDINFKGTYAQSIAVPVSGEWVKIYVTVDLSNPLDLPLILVLNILGNDILFSAPQLEYGSHPTLYQPTDNTLSDSDEYGAWFNRGGIGGTIQNPLLKLNEDGSISSSNGSFVINRDGSGYFAGGSIKWTNDKVELGDNVKLTWDNLNDETKDNLKGDAGVDGYSVLLSPESIVLPSESTGTVIDYSLAKTSVNLLQGSVSLPFIISIVNQVGCTASIVGATVAIVSATNNWGFVEFSVTYNDFSCIKRFSYTKSIKAKDGVDSNLLDWVLDWNSSKTTIESNTILTPKIYAGSKNADGTITGVAIGCFPLKTVSTTGIASVENINGVYGFKDGKKTFGINTDGSVFIGSENDSIQYNPTTGKITFGSNVVLNWQNYTDSQISNISIGARNYQKDISKGYVTLGSTITNITNRTLTITYNTAPSPTPYAFLNPLAEYEIGKMHTFSFWVKATISDGSPSCIINFGIRNSGSVDYTQEINANEWIRITRSVTLTQYNSGSKIIIFTCQQPKGITLDIKDVYVGAGNKNPEDWTPAIEDTQSSINAVSSNANNITTALGGISFPKLTNISSTGIYTGTLTASQVNAVAISASSITSGILSADRISVNSLNGDKIVSGSITATQINTSSLQSALITTSYIEGLSLNFTRGTIGNWNISANGIINGNIQLSSDGAIVHSGGKWNLKQDGSGYIASGNISWDAVGSVSFSNSVQLSWQNYTDNQIKNVQIGGRNYVLNSDFTKLTSDAVNWKISAYNTYIYKEGVACYTVTTSNVASRIERSFNLSQGTYTISLLARAKYGFIFGSFSNATVISQETTKVDDFVIHWATFEVPTTGSVIVRPYFGSRYIVGDDIYIKYIKLEDGNKVTSYSEAPEDVQARIDIAKTTSDSTVNALGGVSFPKLTNISSTGIYTGTLTATQVNAVAISGNSITAGIISADRIAVGSLSGDKIISGTITATQINASSLQSALITTSYIQGLSLNFTKGTIGGWGISASGITNGNVSLSASGTIQNLGKWILANDGSGSIASGNISWDVNGNVTFSSALQLTWQNYTDNKISGIQIGGRNYVLLPWSKSLILPEATSSLQEVNFNVSSALTSQTADATYTISFLCEPKYADGRPFSTLVIGKAGSGDTWSYRIDYYSFTRNILPDGKIKCVCTVKVNRSNGDAIYTLCRFLAETYHVKTGCTITDFKIEDGNKATTWSPAIEDTQANIESAQTTANNTVSALGGASFPKLTQISATGIYTGSITASQITAGTISVDRLDASSIRTNIINTSYIEGLSLNVSKGTIGGWNITSDSITMEDAHKYRLLLDYVYCEPVLAELNLVRVKKTIYHNRFNPVVNRNFTGIVSFMEVDVNSTGKLQALFPSIHINYGELAKAAQKLKKSIKSLSKEIALTTKGYYLDMEDGVLTVADTQMGKPDTDINRIAMEFAIREIFDEIEHTTGHSELIAGELCESSPYVIVNIGSVNIDSKKEPCPTYDKLLADRITKALKSLVD
ncbi:hypothetical protein KL86DYS2_10490 [uncultured Dysgonomonas sp.]|uniref:Peptidase S74 domain-containing protein n=1 Tax=uncultured Dysgonomonas sp. TaxID=206096 RepID=A0A212J1D7_9BACT|nr:hypothetical protein [uncultured Dysgonomonas sp.]SBV93154.1 hypothetical protein KL86DYS2_10490 [uncultured Dysgonomonas sp.]